MLLFFGVLMQSFMPYHEAQTIGRGNPNFSELSGRFAKLAEEKGGVYAFSVLKLAELPQGADIHLLGHAIGDILYKQKGIAGIADCTQDFRNACSHTIVIGALNDFGAQALPKIREACKAAPGGSGAYTMCYHGLGHGVLAYFGFDLSKTVAFCKQVGTAAYRNREYTECVGGAIMELADGGGHDRDLWLAARKKYFTSDPVSPCMSTVIPTEAKPACLEYLTPQLWTTAGIDLGHPNPALFPVAFQKCEAIPNGPDGFRNDCYASFGKEFVTLAGARDVRNVANYSNEEFKLAIRWCASAPESDARTACIGEAVNSVFWGGENDPQGSFRFCSLVEDGYMQGACYQSLAVNIRQYLPSRSDLCQALPLPYLAACSSHD
jgi:hypothetical protein